MKRGLKALCKLKFAPQPLSAYMAGDSLGTTDDRENGIALAAVAGRIPADVCGGPDSGRPRAAWLHGGTEPRHGLPLEKRTTEPGARAELKGPFFKDYWKSIQGYGGWGNGDSQFVNYVGHSMMGASSGWIYVHPETAGMADLVVTPTLGIGVLILEDVLAIKRRRPNQLVVAFARNGLNPNRSFANMLRLKKPYHRDTRRLKR